MISHFGGQWSSIPFGRGQSRTSSPSAPFNGLQARAASDACLKAESGREKSENGFPEGHFAPIQAVEFA
jgi:hypothetical protein